MTPEGRVKAKIKKVLAKYPTYFFMPVPCGYGQQSLDFVGWINGQAFAIEAKAEKGRLSERQKMIIDTMRQAGAKVFVIIGEESDELKKLDEWLASLS